MPMALMKFITSFDSAAPPLVMAFRFPPNSARSFRYTSASAMAYCTRSASPISFSTSKRSASASPQARIFFCAPERVSTLAWMAAYTFSSSRGTEEKCTGFTNARSASISSKFSTNQMG